MSRDRSGWRTYALDVASLAATALLPFGILAVSVSHLAAVQRSLALVALAAANIAFPTDLARRHLWRIRAGVLDSCRASGRCLPKARWLRDPAALGYALPGERARLDHLPVAAELRAALRSNRLVVVHGQPGADQQSVAFDALRKALPNHRVVRPVSADQLAMFVRRAPVSRRFAVWIDGLGPDVGSATADALRTLVAAKQLRVVVVLILGTDQYSRFVPRPAMDDPLYPVRLPISELLGSAAVVRIDHPGSQPMATYRSRLRPLTDRYDQMRDGNPVAAAVVDACVAWRGAGRSAVPRDVLRELCEAFLPDPCGTPGRLAFRSALREACRTIEGTPIVARDPAGRYAVNDHVFEYRRREIAPIPETVWELAIAGATGAEAFDVGIAARELGRLDRAAQAFDRAAQAVDPAAATIDPAAAASAPVAAAMYLHAVVIGEAGRLQSAVSMLEKPLAVEADAVLSASIRTMKAIFLGRRGRPGRAADELADLVRSWPDGSIEAFCAQHYYYRWGCEDGGAAMVLPSLESLAQLHLAHHPRDRSNLLAVRHTIAHWTSKVEYGRRLADSVQLFDGLVAGYDRTYGGEHPASFPARLEWLGARAELAQRQGDAGALTEAVEELARLERRATELLGPLHPGTLEVRRGHYRWLAEAGEVPQALALLGDLVEDCVAALLDTHDQTLASRASHAYWLSRLPDDPRHAGERSNLSTAIGELRDVIRTAEACLDEDHPQLRRYRWELAEALSMGSVHLSIQPVYGPDNQVDGYELSFASTANADAQAAGSAVGGSAVGGVSGGSVAGGASPKEAPVEDARATSHVIINTVTTFNLTELLGDLDLFINLPREFLVGGYRIPLDPQRVILTLPEATALDDLVLAGVRRLAGEGFRIAICPAGWTAAHAALLPYVTHVKIDMANTGWETARQITAECLAQPRPPTLVGWRITTHEQLTRAYSLTCRMVQGDYFCHPMVLSKRAVPSSTTSRMRLAASLLEPDQADMRDVIAQVRADPGLASTIVKWCNSCAAGLYEPVTSVDDAIIKIGLVQVGDLAALLALAPLAVQDRGGLVSVMTWSRLCELVAANRGESAAKAFLVGLVVGIAEYQNRPAVDVAAEHHLAAELVAAIADRHGPLGEVLDIVAAYREGGAVRNAAHVPYPELRNMYLAAFGDSVRTADIM